MIKNIIKAMYSAFISIVLISIILAGWTTYAFIFQSSKSTEIEKVLQDIYASQKTFLADVIDLSKLLIKDTSNKLINENKNVLVEKEFILDREDNFQIDQSSITEDNGDNPLGIVIKPSLPDIIEEPLVNDQKDFSITEMEIIS